MRNRTATKTYAESKRNVWGGKSKEKEKEEKTS